VVAGQWGQYLESAMGRQVAPGRYEAPQGEPMAGDLAPFGMMFPRAVLVTKGPGKMERKVWFPTDPGLMATAQGIAGQVTLKRCAADRCLAKPPRVVVGGNGVSGQAFVDNAELRTWAYQVFQARVLDMETAAVAQVAYVHDTPFIAFRSLSDLAGGDPGKNQARVFFQLASDNSAAVVEAFISALP
jgi:adenosylhomocysteine nucleosidase